MPVGVLAGIGTLGMVILGMLTDTLRGSVVGNLTHSEKKERNRYGY
jgi:hypothetical protein